MADFEGNQWLELRMLLALSIFSICIIGGNDQKMFKLCGKKYFTTQSWNLVDVQSADDKKVVKSL